MNRLVGMSKQLVGLVDQFLLQGNVVTVRVCCGLQSPNRSVGKQPVVSRG